MNNEQTYQDAEYCEQISAEYRKGVKDKIVAAACEANAQRFDRLARYARKATYTPQREIVELRSQLVELADEYVNICDHDMCDGDRSVGIPGCPFYDLPDVDFTGKPIPGGCRIYQMIEKYKQEAPT